ncbi:MAG: YqaE/Pmp3 family membrane protein [Opitutales bacterium TMED158]|nr:MAG: YqaE/Pmp3 family membrane protein [Opitutales bacterium TMED158]
MDNKIVKIILAILLPPVGAFLQVGATKHLLINVILTILGYVPGIIHGLWLILTDQKG